MNKWKSSVYANCSSLVRTGLMYHHKTTTVELIFINPFYFIYKPILFYIVQSSSQEILKPNVYIDQLNQKISKPFKSIVCPVKYHFYLICHQNFISQLFYSIYSPQIISLSFIIFLSSFLSLRSSHGTAISTRLTFFALPLSLLTCR